MGFLSKIFSSLSKMSIPIFSFDANLGKISFKLLNDERYFYDLKSYEIKTRHDSYVLEAYTLKTEDIHLEYIHLDSFSSWNGLSRSFYTKLISDKLKLDLKLEERIDFNNYEFSTYLADDSFIFHLIYIWENGKDILIIDTKGELYKNLLSSFKSNYNYKFEDFDKGSVNFDISLVKENSLKSYFNAN